MKFIKVDMTNVCVFTGCSYTEGFGLEFGKSDPGLWCNILHQYHPILSNSAYKNLALAGASNDLIFHQTLDALATIKPRFLFVGWTESHRLRINPGLEIYETGRNINLSDALIEPIELNYCTYSSEYIKNIKDRFFDLQNLHYCFIDILNKCRIIKNLSDIVGTQVFFINALLEWDDLYFNHITNDTRKPNQLTEVTKKLINIDNRDDEEIFRIYDRMHAEYQQANGLNSWLNLYNSIRNSFYIDKGNDNMHPGYASNKKFAEFLLNNTSDKSVIKS